MPYNLFVILEFIDPELSLRSRDEVHHPGLKRNMSRDMRIIVAKDTLEVRKHVFRDKRSGLQRPSKRIVLQ